MRKIILVLVFVGLSFSSVFNRVNTLINTPIVRTGMVGQFYMGGSYAPYLPPAGTVTTWEDDYYLNYQVTDRLQIGLTRTNGATTVANMQLVLAKNYATNLDFAPVVDIAFGVEQITGRDKDSTIESVTENNSNAMSTYIEATSLQMPWEYTVGFGMGRLMNASKGASILNNLFFSVSYYLSKDIRTGGRCTLEYDSKDFNLGFHLPINESFALNLALTQLPFRTGINSAYGVNVPYENLSIGVDYTFNLFAFYGAEYRRLATQYRDLEDKSVYVNDKLKVIVNNVDQSEQAMVDLREQKSFMMSELKKDIDEARKQKEQLKGDVKALRDIIASEGFKSVNTLKEDILKYYYRALQYYYDEKYFEAIGELSKANLINDQIPEIHIRMGSIYWTMGLRNEALAAWRKAYGLDKNNEVLNTFLLEHHVDIKQWGPK